MEELQEPPVQDPPIKKTYNWIKANNPLFKVDFATFQQDMADPEKLGKVHDWIKQKNPDFKIPLDQFASDMGTLKKKVASPMAYGQPGPEMQEPSSLDLSTISPVGSPADEPTIIAPQGDLGTPYKQALAEQPLIEQDIAAGNVDPKALDKIASQFNQPQQQELQFQPQVDLQKQAADEHQMRINAGIDEKDREANPFITMAKSAWNTLAYQLPSAMVASFAATAKPSMDRPSAEAMFPDFSKTIKTGEEISKENKGRMLEWAAQHGLKGDKLTDDLVSTMDKIKDPIDMLNWASFALGQAAGQIPASVATGGITSMGQEVGSIYMDGVKKIAQEKGLSIEDVINQDLDKPAFALAYGTAAGLLDYLSAKNVINASKGSWYHALKARGLNIAKSAFVEGSTEYAQTWMEQIGSAQTAGHDLGKAWEEANTHPAAMERLESAAQGAIGGPGMHVGSKIASLILPEKQIKAPEGDLGKLNEKTPAPQSEPAPRVEPVPEVAPQEALPVQEKPKAKTKEKEVVRKNFEDLKNEKETGVNVNATPTGGKTAELAKGLTHIQDFELTPEEHKELRKKHAELDNGIITNLEFNQWRKNEWQPKIADRVLSELEKNNIEKGAKTEEPKHEENAIPERPTEKVGSHPSGDESAGGGIESSGMGSVQQGTEVTSPNGEETVPREVGKPPEKEVKTFQIGGSQTTAENAKERVQGIGHFGPGGKFKVIGENTEGNLIGEDKNGVRAVLEGKVVSTQPVGMVPTEKGMQIQVDKPSGEFLTKEEAKPEEKPFFREVDMLKGEIKETPKKSELKKEHIKKLFGELDELIGPGRVSITEEHDKDKAHKIALKGAEIVGAYVDYGITKFAEIAKQVYEDHGEPALRKFLQALKAGYGHLQAEREDLDDMKEVRKHTVDSLIESFKQEGNGNPNVPISPSSNTPELAGGEPTPTPGQTVPRESTEKPADESSGASPVEPGQPETSGEKGGRGVGGGNIRTPSPGTSRPTTPTVEPQPAAHNTDESRVGLSEVNHVIAPEDTIVPSGEVAKIRGNIAAIKLVKDLIKENRNATPEEKKVLAKFVGWGGLASVLDKQKFRSEWDENWNKKYQSFHKQIADLLDEDEFQTAVNSTINAHYTDRRVIQSLWDLVRRLGFTHGNVLEPSAGVGHFFGLMPQEMATKSQLRAYELDKLTGQILTKLYPEARVRVEGYENSVEANNSQDLVISNVPFAAKAPFDKKNPDIAKFSLHNYFIAKGIRQLKPGGLGIFITSSSSMDNPGASTKFREWTNGEGNSDFIGAIRLPNNAFSENAGTEVTTDILIYKKRTEDAPGPDNQQYRNVVPIDQTKNAEGEDVDIDVNEYFAAHPDMMLGKMMLAYQAGSGGLYSENSQTLKAPAGQDTMVKLQEAIQQLPENVFGAQVSAQKETAATETDKEGTLIEKGGKLFSVENGVLVPQGEETISVKGKKYKTSEVVKDYTAIKDSIRALLKAEQGSEATDKQIEDLRTDLNRTYDKFTGKYGPFNRNRNLGFLEEDADHYSVYALEDIQKESTISESGKVIHRYTIRKSPIFSRRVNFPVQEPTTAETTGDAMNISLSYRNKIDLPYVASMTGLSEEAAKKELLSTGLAFENPQTGLLEDADSYLSGFVRTKLRQAEEAGEGFEKNVEELKKVVPKDIPAAMIEFKLGSTWLPADFVTSFLEDQLGVRARVAYNEHTGGWITSLLEGRDQRNQITYASGNDFTAFDLINKALNLRQPEVSYTVKNADGSKSTVKDAAKTAQAQEKMQALAELFYNYVKGNKDMVRRLEELYNFTYNDFIEKKYSLPSFTHFPGAEKDVTLRIHQRKAVARVLHDSTLLAHEVGTGKTYTMITAAMEMRRLGIAHKPLIVVQNATLEQFAASFKKLYPSASILAPTKKDMDSKHRQTLFNKIAYGDWDSVIIPQSFLDYIPDDPERESGYLKEQLDDLQGALEEAKLEGDRGTASELNRAIKDLQKRLDEVEEGKEKKTRKVKDIAKENLAIEKAHLKQANRKKDDVLNFENMGVDALFLDEAHAYKKLGFLTKMSRIKGIDIGRSKRALGAFLKTRWIQEKNKGRNVILATGTPITNTMAEVWTMMKFVAPDILDRYKIKSFDEFASTFGLVEPSLEFTAQGKFKIVERFKSYINAPELLTAFRAKTDVVLTEDIPEFKEDNTIPKLKTQPDGKQGYTQVILKQSTGLQQVMAQFKQILENWEKLPGKEKRKLSYIPLLVFNRAKQAAIDLRLLDPKATDDPGSKTNAVVKEAKRIYDETESYKGAQLIFSDMYQSPEAKEKFLDEEGTIPNPAFGEPRFNLYHDMRDKLIQAGIKPEEVAIVHDYEGEKRNLLFEKVKTGEVRILLGSTERMGVGVNVQDKLAALHHMDAPPRPMDFAQRNGRILRQGNLHAEMGRPVEIVTYGVEKTLDATAYQRLAFKQKFINQMMKAEGVDRVMSDEADEDNATDMTFDQMMSTLSGSQYAVLHTQRMYELRKLRTAKSNHDRMVIDLSSQIRHSESIIKALTQTEKDYKPFQQEMKAAFPDNKLTTAIIQGKEVTEKIGESLQLFLEDKFKELDRISTPTLITSFKANGLNVYMEVKKHFNIQTGKSDKFVSHYNIERENGKQAVMNQNKVGTGQGLVTSINSAVANFVDDGWNGYTNVNTIPERIEKNEKDIVALHEQVKKPFDKADKLVKIEEEVKGLEEKMKAENQEAPAPEEGTKPMDLPDPDEHPTDYEGEQATTKKYYQPPIGSPKKSRKANVRLSVSPIYGGDAKLLRQIVIDLSKSIPAKIYYTKRPPKNRAFGVYSPKNAAIAIRFQGDLDTVAHEVGHSLDDVLDMIGQVTPEVEKELLRLGKFTSPKKATNSYKINEGMAEYIRAWLVNPSDAIRVYPKTSALFDTAVPKETQDKLRVFGDDIRKYVGLSGHHKIMSNVEFEPDKSPGLFKRFMPNSSPENFEMTFWDRLATNWTNPMRAFEKGVYFLLDKQQIADLKPADNPILLSRLLAGGNDTVIDTIKNGFKDVQNPVSSSGKGFKVNRLIDPVSNQPMTFEWLLAPLDPSSEESIKQEQQETISYMIAQRTLELESKLNKSDFLTGIGAGIFQDTKVAEQRLAEHDAMDEEKQARIEEAARRYRMYAQQSLEYAVAKGRLSQQSLDEINQANFQYVALNRLAEAAPDEEVIGFNKTENRSLGAVKQLIQKIHGSTKTIKNPYESLVENTIRSTKEADRNEALMAFEELFTASRKMHQGSPINLGSVAREVRVPGVNTITVFKDGVAHHYQLDPDIYKAVKNLTENIKLPGWQTALARLIRFGVINFPVFALRNRIRDIQSRFVISGTRPEAGFDIYTTRKLQKENKAALHAFGGGQAGYYFAGPEQYQKLLAETTRELAQDKKNIILNPKLFMDRAGSWYSNAISSGEMATRSEEYRSAFKHAKRQGLDDYNAALSAAFQARDLLDFAVAGEQMKKINQIIPFTNAAVQGLRKAIKSAQTHPGEFAVRWMIYSLVPALFCRLFAHWEDKDEEYANLPNYRRDLFYNFPIGGGHWLIIPKSFDMGVISSGGERLLSYLFYDDNKAMDGYAGSVARSLLPLDDAALAGPFRSPVEVLANYDFFRNAHIIPTEEEGRELRMRNTETASRLGQAIAKPMGVDPRYIDYMAKANVGYLGDMALRLSDIGREDSRHPLNWTATGFVSEDPVYNSKDVQDLMDTVKKYAIPSSDKNLRLFNMELGEYFREKTAEMKEKQGKTVRQLARDLQEYFGNEYSVEYREQKSDMKKELRKQ